MPPIIDTIEKDFEEMFGTDEQIGDNGVTWRVYQGKKDGSDVESFLHTSLLRAYQEGQKEGYTRGWDNGERHELEASVSGEVVIAKEKVAQIRKSEREATIQEVVEKAEGMKSHNSHISPIDSGYNNALSDLIASLKK